MSRLILFIKRHTSTKKILTFFLLSHIVLLVMMTYTFPIIHAQIGTNAFDLQSFGYSLSSAQTIVKNLDRKTMLLYLFPQLSLFDVLYPFLIALFFSTLLCRRMKRHRRFTSILLLIPFLGMGFDYLENICIALMITKTIDLDVYVVGLSSCFTVLKGICTTVAWGSILLAR